MMNRSFMARLIPACALAAMAILTAACSDDESDDFVGGASGDMGIVAKDIAGLAQKGPFVKGSKVTVQGIDCKTLELTDEIFEGKINSDKGDFAFDDVTLSSTCALFEVSGIYRNEITGNTTSESVTLFALSDLKDRGHVNVNMLTDLECKRVLYLVTEKSKKFADAKKQAEKEVLAAFGIAGDFDNSEDLTIYESGDGNAALLAVSVLMQAGTDVPGLEKRMDGFKDSFAETGKWSDDKTKAAIEEWQIAATADGTLDSIRKNVEHLGYADEVPAFEKYIEAFGDTVILSSDSSEESSSGSRQSSSSTPVEDLSSSSSEPAEGTLTDSRDGQTYRTVKIGDQVWMAENLNFETDSSFCYNDSAEYCAKYGRLYIWDAAMDACPDGWHLPDSTEWNTLFSAVGGKSTAGEVLKSTSGWVGNKGEATNGTDNYGFAALPAGFRDERGGLFSREGGTAKFWSSTERSSDMATNIILYYYFDVFEASGRHDAMSVRCLNDDTAVPPSSSSSKPVETSSSSAKADGSEYDATANTLKDLRDGKVYRTMQLGVQTWMAENLNFETKGSLCYHDSAEYCAKYGRLYPWSVAMDSMGIWGANGKGCGFGSTCPSKYPVRGVCPSGWHVPTQMDWTVLFEEVGGSSIAGKVLKSISGWSGRGDNTGTDDFGFSALPAGHYTSVEGLDGKAGTVAFFASSTERDKNSSYYVYLDYKDEARFSNCDETAGLSVRCVMDDDGSISPSSSSGNSSSSELKREQCDVDTDGNCFKDERDGQTYRTVIIGTQTWMAENLNYAYTGVPYKYENDASDSISWCYGNDPAYCAKYGRLYTWAAAMDSVGAWTENSKGCGYGKACSPTYPVQGVCPSGWHLPTEEEFRTLFTTVGGD
ncbi:major paralogous domain-containing protein [Fibrobacter sp. UWR3]|nr:major paralogous domain-containing protein [Fibrobacter sp. UWR3]